MTLKSSNKIVYQKLLYHYIKNGNVKNKTKILVERTSKYISGLTL